MDPFKDFSWQLNEPRPYRQQGQYGYSNGSLVSLVESENSNDGPNGGEAAAMEGVGYGALTHRASKLDLIDNTTLTSLPIAPPPKPHRKSSTKYLERTQSDDSGPKDRKHEQIEEDDLEMQTTLDDITYDEEDESQDPIVLVEDYMEKTLPSRQNDSEMQNKLTRKRSLATFKRRLHQSSFTIDIDNTPELPTISSLHPELRPMTTMKNDKPKNKRTISEETVHRPALNSISSSNQDIEAVFGKIPGSESLKHCEICEKPLYEISSLINGHQRYKKSKTNGPRYNERPSSMCELYEEFICWECVETYEEFFDELYKNEFDSNDSKTPNDTNINTVKSYSGMSSLGNREGESNTEASALRLVGIFRGIENKYHTNIRPQEKVTNGIENSVLKRKGTFSNLLVDRLKSLNNPGPSPPKRKRSITDDILWINNLRQKLKWSWNFTADVQKTPNMRNLNMETM